MPARAVKPSIPTADEVPITRGMLVGVRTEILHRIDEVREEVKAEIHGVKAEIHGVKAEIHEVKASVARMDAKLDRMLVLYEAQEARNKVVLDGYASLSTRVDQVEQRVTGVEDTIHHLATARPAG